MTQARVNDRSYRRPRRRITSLLVAACLPVSVLLVATGGTADATVPPAPTGWTTVFSDDFNGPAGTGVDTSNWLYDTGTGYPGGAANWGTGEVETMSSSTANVYQDGQGHVAADLRVDDHPAPVEELARLLDLNDFYLTPPPDRDKIPITDELAAELEQRARAAGSNDFAAWVGTNNYEMRVADDLRWVDRRVLDIIRRA